MFLRCHKTGEVEKIAGEKCAPQAKIKLCTFPWSGNCPSLSLGMNTYRESEMYYIHNGISRKERSPFGYVFPFRKLKFISFTLMSYLPPPPEFQTKHAPTQV